MGAMRHFGFLASLVVLALLGSACSGPSSERQPFEIPTEIVPEWLNPSDPEELFTGGGCLLAVGGGVRVLEVLGDTGAHGVLRPGDIITSIDGTPTSSQETLLRVLGGRRPGDLLEVEGTRVGEAFSIGVALSPVPGEPERAILGIIPETKLEVVAPSRLSASGSTDPFSRPMVLDGGVYLHGPLAAAWLPHVGLPPVRTAALGSDLYAVTAADPLALVRIGGGVTIPIDPGPTLFEGGAGPIELVASEFETVLTSVGNPGSGGRRGRRQENSAPPLSMRSIRSRGLSCGPGLSGWHRPAIPWWRWTVTAVHPATGP